jgi:alpha-amylase/alpha-mannosidase (GH57 family)
MYKSPLTGQYRLPWVRLHGIKDYLDLILVLGKYPKLHQTVNLVPSLLTQLEDYVAGKASDPYLELLLKPVETFTLEQKAFVVDRFFDGYYPTLIEPYTRYRELHEHREQRGQNWCLQQWTTQDFSDLLAWHNLAWFDPLYHQDPVIERWLHQQKGFTLADREGIWTKQQQILSGIIPHHAKMQADGQLEIITSPYSHPILPLLANERSARIACPHLHLPRYGFHWEADVVTQLKKARASHTKYFHQDPKGLWPSEQAVSPAILTPILAEGFEWIVSDETILEYSLATPFERDKEGHLLQPEILYRPYRLETENDSLSILFRDRRLSDLIGFSYSTLDANTAAKDLIAHLETIRNRLPQDSPWLVTIALDGENCWEYYPEDGRLFLENLYTRLSQHPVLKLVTVSEYLEQFPPTTSLQAEQLHTGSWIEGSLSTWIGDPVKNRAWELLAQARQLIEGHPRAQESTWDALWAAEGSDWFWWYGAGHSSMHDAVFDQLFREHLQFIYQDLGEEVPEVLLHPLEEHDGLEDHPPQGFIHPIINGHSNDQEWARAGRIHVNTSGNRHTGVRKLWYGCDHFHLYLRMDFNLAEERPPHIRVYWSYPQTASIHPFTPPLSGTPDQPLLNYPFRHALQVFLWPNLQVKLLEAKDAHHWQEIPQQVHSALDTCLELSIPWTNLAIQPGRDIQFVVVVINQEEIKEVIPASNLLMMKVP